MTSMPAPKPLEEDALALQEALTTLIRVYQFRDRDAICCYDVSLAQSHALERLHHLGPSTLNEFAAALFLEKSSASRLVNALERKGHVTRRPHPDDTRSVLITLTKRGTVVIEKILRDLLEERAQILADLTPRDRKVVVQSIDRLARAAAARVDTRGGACVRV